MKNRIYLDYAATTPVRREVLEEMLPFYSDQFGNPSGVYGTAREAHRAIEHARRQVAAAIGAEPGEIYFTSGGTESDNMAIQGAARALSGKGRHIITSRIEHHAVLNTCKWLERTGWDITYLPVDHDGKVSPEDVEKAITPDTVLISIMAANNEIGTIEPYTQIGEIARNHGILFHTDAVQAIGTIKMDMSREPIDMMSLSAHKLYGPKGVGVLYIRRGTRIDHLLFGGAQERGLRSGTENTPGIVGMGKAIEIVTETRNENVSEMIRKRDMLIREILENIPDAFLNGPKDERLAFNTNFSFCGVEGEALLLRMDLAGIAASGGSACSSGNSEPSHVLKAIGRDDQAISGSIRMTLGSETTDEEVQTTVQTVRSIVEDLRSMRDRL